MFNSMIEIYLIAYIMFYTHQHHTTQTTATLNTFSHVLCVLGLRSPITPTRPRPCVCRLRGVWWGVDRRDGLSVLSVARYDGR